jgi:Flp pilus assembly pilin Flp
MTRIWRGTREAARRLARDQSGIASLEYLLIAALIYGFVMACMGAMLSSLSVAYAYMMKFFCSPVL